MSLVGDLIRAGIWNDKRGVLGLQGASYKPGATTQVKVLVTDGADKVLWATGTTVPTDGEAGYAKGCLFIDTDVAGGTTGLYVNVGTTSSCNFDAVSDA